MDWGGAFLLEHAMPCLSSFAVFDSFLLIRVFVCSISKKCNFLFYFIITMSKQKMKYCCSTATIAIYFLFTFLWMDLFIIASQDDMQYDTDLLDDAQKVQQYIF